MTYSRTAIKLEVGYLISGIISDTVLIALANKAIRDVVADVDLAFMKRKSALAPNLFDDVYQYTAPADLKGMAVIDIMPQINRGRHLYWRLTTPEEFDRNKEENRIDRFGDPIDLDRGKEWLGVNYVAVQKHSGISKLLLSSVVDDKELVISTLDAVGDWVVFGDGTNLTRDTENYVKGNASLNWDISAAGGTTAGIQNSLLANFNISDYAGNGSAFVWAYITSATNLTNFILRIGNDSSNYYAITITTTNEGTAFEAGWNLLRFDMVNKVETGAVDKTICKYVALYMTKAAGKISETDYRFDNLVLKIGDHFNVVYYSKYGWQSNAGVWLENSTADTDLINCDTDEYGLIMAKYAELCEQHLKNAKQSDRMKLDYEIKKKNYQLTHPSEALTMINEYYAL